MDDRRGNLFWGRHLRYHKPGIEHTGAKPNVKIRAVQGNRRRPHTFEVSSEAFITEPIVGFDKRQGFSQPAENWFWLVVECTDPQTIDGLTIRQEQTDPVQNPRTRAPTLLPF